MARSVARRLLYVFTPKGWGGQAFLTVLWLFLAYFAISVAFETGRLWAYFFTLIFVVLALRSGLKFIQEVGRTYLAVKKTRKRD
jgi:hypothetical protein